MILPHHGPPETEPKKESNTDEFGNMAREMGLFYGLESHDLHDKCVVVIYLLVACLVSNSLGGDPFFCTQSIEKKYC